MTDKTQYYVYVIQLKESIYQKEKKFREANSQYKEGEGKPCVYVGQSYLKPKERFEKHKSGHKSSRYVKQYGQWVKKKRIPHKNPHSTRKSAEKREEQLAEILKKRGWAVWWN